MSRRRPSYSAGFYSPKRGGVARHPELWRGCVGAWAPLLGSTGDLLFDHSVNSNIGVLTGMDPATDWTVRSGGIGLLFNGNLATTDYAIRLPKTSFSTTGRYSVHCSFSLASLSGGQARVVTSKLASSTGRQGYSIERAENSADIQVRIGDSVSSDLITATTGVADQLMNVAFSYDQTDLLIYVNGKLVSSTAINRNSDSSNRNLFIGAVYQTDTTVNHVFDGTIFEVRNYERILTPSEFATLAVRRGIAYELAPRQTSIFGPLSTPKATGGTVTLAAGYKIHTFTTDGTFTVTGGLIEAEHLTIAGGGSGATQIDGAGGGGAGGLRTNVGGVTLTLAPGTYAITVGAGGAAVATANTIGNPGAASSIAALVIAGAGGRGLATDNSGLGEPAAAGSGGGIRWGGTSAVLGTSGQGNNGGLGSNGADANRAGGGGGGAGGIGGNGIGTGGGTGGTGGVGIASSISGIAEDYAGGGGGATNGAVVGSASHGGGTGGRIGVDPTAGTANRGSGGGAGIESISGAGGSGIVVLRYAITHTQPSNTAVLKTGNSLRTGLLAYYPFSEGTGTPIDRTGLTTITTGENYTWEDGPFGKMLSRSSGARANLTQSYATDSTLTFAFLVRSEILNHAGSSSGGMLASRSTDRWRFEVISGTSRVTLMKPTPAWELVICSQDNVANTIMITLNGTHVPSAAYTPNAATGIVYLFNVATGLINYSGYASWNRLLTTAEMQRLTTDFYDLLEESGPSSGSFFGAFAAGW